MKLDPTALIQVDNAVAEECAKYETADRPFILIFTLDMRRQNYLTLMPRPRDDGEYYGPWLDSRLPRTQSDQLLKKYSQETSYESDDCFIAVYTVPSECEEAKTSVFLIEPEDAYRNEVELYRMKGSYIASAFNAYRCLIFPTLKAAISNT
ncbi:hypothetical protein GGI03_003499 [Coemansia sp. RSA 2337]|nr:hypothetical protein LPJ71_003180 [Coemansia sp. S17]KAJ2013355.1 hypothetical protein GGI14_005419 [Coemansia sp. S680]KAJ2026590.1 hypothetical protein H4S03_008589 [Coemansia sp. S3946]KAJ2095845.1 hypothetical protein GGI16_005067 [Coemansia sp. S142-1]KAJ2097512.1 hypothetical protein GGI09_003789 [Coemansia sp. S100]KAJ2335956.1 hypothetical protein GGH92_007888 [Coemansia sp. RSA 2673]KAJ2463995.1 hypothetical protein GGI03_003499 [Coemansia sp. RSA 2337]